MKQNKQTVFVQLLAFITAALSVIFLRQYQQAKATQRNLSERKSHHSLPKGPEILLENSEVALFEEIIVTPIES